MFFLLSKILPIKYMTTTILPRNFTSLIKASDSLRVEKNLCTLYPVTMTSKNLIRVLSEINAQHDSSEITQDGDGIIHRYIVNDGGIGSGLEVHDIDGKYSFHPSDKHTWNAVLMALINPEITFWG
jgi:hypothetical protein